jgi:predicted RNase H-like HicB family nuclease
MKRKLRIPLRIVFYREEDTWIAHCLEFNLLGDGKTQAEALAQLSEAIQLQAAASIEYDNPRNLFSPADGKFFGMFAAGEAALHGELHLNIETIEIEETETREYTGSLDDFPSTVCLV